MLHLYFIIKDFVPVQHYSSSTMHWFYAWNLDSLATNYSCSFMCKSSTEGLTLETFSLLKRGLTGSFQREWIIIYWALSRHLYKSWTIMALPWALAGLAVNALTLTYFSRIQTTLFSLNDWGHWCELIEFLSFLDHSDANYSWIMFLSCG